MPSIISHQETARRSDPSLARFHHAAEQHLAPASASAPHRPLCRNINPDNQRLIRLMRVSLLSILLTVHVDCIYGCFLSSRQQCTIQRQTFFEQCPGQVDSFSPRRQKEVTLSACRHADNSHPESRGVGSQSLSRRQIVGNIAASALTTTASGLILPKVSVAASTPAQIPMIRLGLGSLEVSRTIQGYWQLAGGHGRYQEADAISNMAAHFDAGMTTLDTADIYGPSELIVGRFVNKQPKAIPITKFCCFRFLDEISREEVKERIQRACERLQVSKLPLVQFFWSQYDVKRYVDVGLWLTELKEEGLIQEIGATNFDLKRLQELRKAGVPIVSHQVQCSAMDRRPVQSGMAQWCAENDISLIAFGTVASGILSNLYLGKGPPSQADRNTASMRLYSSTAARFGDWQLVQELLQTMNAIAADVRKDGRCADANISNIAQRYVLETPAVASVLIGVRNQEHIAENVRTHSFQLNQDERDAIDKVVAKREGPKGDVWDIERGMLI